VIGKWKKIYGDINGINGITYRKVNAKKILDRNSFITIQRKYNLNRKEHKVFFENQSKKLFWNKEFKNKSQALDYAKNYMRKN